MGGTSLVALDVETTGLDVERHGLIQIGLASVEEPRHRVAGDVNPGPFIEIDDEVLDVNGFTPKRIAAAPPAANVDADIAEWLTELFGPPTGDLVAVGWNVWFDVQFVSKFLPRTAAHFGHRVLDLNSLCFALECVDGVSGSSFFKEEAKAKAVERIGHEAFDVTLAGDALAAVYELGALLEQIGFECPRSTTS